MAPFCLTSILAQDIKQIRADFAKNKDGVLDMITHVVTSVKLEVLYPGMRQPFNVHCDLLFVIRSFFFLYRMLHSS
jgi:hypothetical protein